MKPSNEIIPVHNPLSSSASNPKADGIEGLEIPANGRMDFDGEGEKALESNRERPETEQENTADPTGEVLLFEGPVSVSTPNNLPENERAKSSIPEAVALYPPFNQAQAEVTSILFSPEEDSVPFNLTELKQLIRRDENFVWVDFANYSELEVRNLSIELELHPLALRATLEGWQRPRFDTFRGRKQYLVTTTIAHLNPGTHQILAAELDLFIGNNFLISLHKTALPFAKKIAQRASESPELVKLDAAFMLYIMLDELLEYYEELSDHLEVETAQMELRALKDTTDTFLTDLVQLKQYIFSLTRLVDQHRKVFATLVRPDNLLTSNEEVSPYFQDLETHFERLVDTLQPAKEAVNGAFEIYVSHISHKTNQIIKTLTILSTILLPSTAILSLFGTNIVGLSQYGVLDFAVMVISIFITSGLILFLFRRQGWI